MAAMPKLSSSAWRTVNEVVAVALWSLRKDREENGLSGPPFSILELKIVRAETHLLQVKSCAGHPSWVWQGLTRAMMSFEDARQGLLPLRSASTNAKLEHALSNLKRVFDDLYLAVPRQPNVRRVSVKGVRV